MMLLNGTEKFMLNGAELDISSSDFWRWAYSDISSNISKSVLAEYIVASALEITDFGSESHRIQFRPFDLQTRDGCRVEVKCASRVQSWECKHPDRISFRISPARFLDPVDGYRDEDPQQRNCDVYVFCIFNGLSFDDSPLNLDLWEFHILKTSILNREKPTQKTITLNSLLELHPVKTDYSGISKTLNQVMSNE